MPRLFFVRALFAACAALALAVAPARAQLGGEIPPAESLVRVTAAPTEARAGATARIIVTLEIQGGWHVNANPPASEEMIATEVTLASGPGFAAGATRYPPGRQEKLSFSDDALLVYDGRVAVEVPVAVSGAAAAGPQRLAGRVRYQACNDQVCLPPVTLPFEALVTVASAGAASDSETSVRGASARAPTDSAAAAGSVPLPPVTTFGGAPGTGASGGGARASALDNPIARLFANGSLLAYLSLFLIGLALNLTPCVYPMMGVTVSIFGARRSAPPLEAFGLASVYVLGMAAMYSALGVAAALTGTLFGGFLQSPLVLLGIGILLVLLALSMFGIYEFQLPASVLSKLGGGGATSVAGIFLSGLVVGIFAAPCTGPPVVALLAVVGAKGDPAFGFLAFFVLALGLGAPYLVLGTFSNLLQRLPRSGTWMVWVKQVFGTIMLSVGLFYILLSAAPKWAEWVLPLALVLGGIHLGFIERSMKAAAARRVQWVLGLLAIAGGIWVARGAMAHGVVFAEFEPAALERTLAAGEPVMLDFSADWCAPCHELEDRTLTDRQVIEAARAFRRFHVDLTHYDSPQSDSLRRRYGITGVPTIVFLTPDGREVREARVEGFLAPRPFGERMALALARTPGR